MMIGGGKNAESIRRILLKQHGRQRRQRPLFILNANRYASFHSRSGSESTVPTSTVVLLRHGQSLWNKIPTFTGWCDVPLTDLGIEQAEGAAHLMKEKGFDFDLVYSSELQRAHKSAEVVLETMNSNRIEPTKAWELNERHYGALQGLSKKNPELVTMYGDEQLAAWRREMNATPPPMDEAHPHYEPPPAPLAESLFDCQRRVIDYWHGTIVPEMLLKDKTVLIAAHANTIRSLIAYLDDVPDESVPHIHIPNSVPFVYKIDPHTGQAVDQDSVNSGKSKGEWLLSAENQERLVEKVGVDSESFARSLFSSWDVDGDGFVSKEELGELLFEWKKDSNPAINALAGKMLEELNADKAMDPINLERFQRLAVSGSRKHNLPFFEDENVSSSAGTTEVLCHLCTRSIPVFGKSSLYSAPDTEERQNAA